MNLHERSIREISMNGDSYDSSLKHYYIEQSKQEYIICPMNYIYNSPDVLSLVV